MKLDAEAASGEKPVHSPRTQRLLQGAIVPTLLLMAWPNVLVMFAQAATGLIETWFVAKLGTDALAGMALVFPGVMLMQMISAGAMGGGISSAIARALGAGRREEADALVLHALIITIVFGAFFSAIMLAFGRPIYRALGGEGGELEAAVTYSNVVFAGNVLLWVMNGLANAIRGTGNMVVPATVTCVGVAVLVPLSPLLIFGVGPFPVLGIAGGGVALVSFYVVGSAVILWYVMSGRNVAKLRFSKLRWSLFRDILSVGAVASVTSVQTNVIIALATALVANAAGAGAAAGYGTAARLEYVLVPIMFGLGAPLVALVGTNFGAGQRERALRIAFVGGAIAFAITETIGIAAAVWPDLWLMQFSANPQVIETGTSYLRLVGPTYGFFGLPLALYFAAQGAGRLFWPLSAGFVRMLIGIGGGYIALRLTGSLAWSFAALALGLFLHGLIVFSAVLSGAVFGKTEDRKFPPSQDEAAVARGRPRKCINRFACVGRTKLSCAAGIIEALGESCRQGSHAHGGAISPTAHWRRNPHVCRSSAEARPPHIGYRSAGPCFGTGRRGTQGLRRQFCRQHRLRHRYR
jgi:putative MATE family efflux protein